MRAHAFAFAAAFILGLFFASAPADARPPAPLSLSLQLNGEASADISPDGGALRLVSATTAVASATVQCGRAYKISCPSLAANFCANSTDGGGCGFALSDQNYGDPIASGGHLYVTFDDCPPNTTKTVYAVSPTGAGVGCVLLRMR